MSHLPTPAEMFAAADAELAAAANSLSEAAAWLRSDWPPGTALTDEQAERRTRMFEGIGEAKAAINRAKGGAA